MSSAPNKSHQSSQSASSPKPRTDAQTDSASQSPLRSPAENSMDQPLESTLIATPPAPPTPSEIMSSTDSSSTDPTPSPETPVVETSATDDPPIASETDSLDQQTTALRQQPIPPASEPMQYRAIGLVRGKYVASDEQFTRGSLFTDDGFEIGAVLLGRVMSLVKKHVNLEEPHLWVVYPRTREKGDSDLHVQIVGVWEPENLNRMFDSAEQESSDQELDEAELADETLETSDGAEEDVADGISDVTTQEPALSNSEVSDSEEPVEPTAETSEAASAVEASDEAEELSEAETGDTSSLDAPVEQAASDAIAATEENTPPVSASELDDKYFSVRGEVIYQSVEEQQILVKIRRAPRPGTDESKAFKVVLKGTLEGKAVGYFWDLHVQREGNILVVQEGTMIGAVPPQKRKKPPFNKRGGGGRRGGGRPPHGGGPRKPWQNRDSQPRPSRGDRSGSDRPIPPNRENRPPSPRPVKRRNPEKPEG